MIMSKKNLLQYTTKHCDMESIKGNIKQFSTQPLKLKQALSKHHSIIEGADHLSTMKTQIKSNTKHTHTFKKYNLIPPNSPIFISLKAKYFFFPCFPNPFIIPELPH